MVIDNNETEKQAMEAFRSGDDATGHRLQNRFLSEVRASGQDHCSCTVKCRHHGHCVDCVVIHRGHQDHLPSCFNSMVNLKIAALSALTEHTGLLNPGATPSGEGA